MDNITETPRDKLREIERCIATMAANRTNRTQPGLYRRLKERRDALKKQLKSA